MILSDEQLQILRENSKDDAAFARLHTLFNSLETGSDNTLHQTDPTIPPPDDAMTEQDFRIIATLATDYTLMMHVMPDGTLQRGWVYGAFKEITGFTLEESAARGGWMALPYAEDMPLVMAEGRKLLSAPQFSQLEYRIVTKDGAIKYLLNRSLSVYDPQEGRITRIYATVKDITQRKLMENAIRENQLFVEQIANRVPYVISVFDFEESRYLYLNDYLLAFLGIERSNNNDLNIPDFRYVHAEDAAIAQELIQQVLKPEDYDVIEGEVRVRRADGVWRWLRLQMIPFQRNADGSVRQVLGIGIDVTDMRDMEQIRFDHQRLQVEFTKEQELSELKTRMMRRISHEFRTPLAVIHASAEMLDQYYTRMDAPARALRFQQIFNTIEHMTTMLDDMSFILKDLARTTTLNLDIIDPIQLCSTLIDELQHRAGAKHVLRLSTPGTLPPIMGDLELLQHALTHLIDNAVSYSPVGKTVLILAEASADHVEIHIRDQGIGIPMHEQGRVYEPFFRGSNIQESTGLGLGLTIVQKIIHAHGGSLTLRSEPDKGTTATVRLAIHRVTNNKDC